MIASIRKKGIFSVLRHERKRKEKRGKEKGKEKGKGRKGKNMRAERAQRAALPRHGGADRVLSLRAFKCAVCKWTYE